MKDIIEAATRRAAILHASAAWGSDEDGHLMGRLIECIEAARAEERARIVAWLRDGKTWLNNGECCGSEDSDGVCFAPACEWGEELKALQRAADAIERGDHLT